MESSIVLICKAGDQLPMFMSVAEAYETARLPTLEHVQADSSQLVNIWMVYLG